MHGPTDELRRGADAAGNGAAPWLERLARLGFAAKGAVYVLLGGLAAAAALGGGRTPDSGAALRALTEAPLGRVILGILAVGLAGYAIWRAVSAVADPEKEGAGARAYQGIAALLHGALAVEAARLALREGGPGGGGGAAEGDGGGAGAGSEASHWAAEALAQPFGRWLLVAVGVMIAAYGLHQIFRSYRVELDERLDFGAMSRSAARWTVRAGRLGIGARGVVFAIMGAFAVGAGIQAQAGEARGVAGALDALREQPYGPWLLGVVALGLLAYGAYNFIRARYRRIRVP